MILILLSVTRTSVSILVTKSKVVQNIHKKINNLVKLASPEPREMIRSKHPQIKK